MTTDKVFCDNLKRLENFRTHPGLKDFYESIEKLKVIGEEICKSSNKKSADVTNLMKKARLLAKNLDENKQLIAARTKTQLEFDAVYDCINYLNKYFEGTRK